MKKLLIALTLTLSLLSVMAADITTISNAFKEGKAPSLQSSLDQEVSIIIPGQSLKSNASKTVSALTDFFRSNQPTGFSVVHHVDKKQDGFFVAKLPTSSGEYRVTITYRSENDKAIIQSIKIE